MALAVAGPLLHTPALALLRPALLLRSSNEFVNSRKLVRKRLDKYVLLWYNVYRVETKKSGSESHRKVSL